MVSQFEDALNDGELCAGCVEATEGTPVVNNHTSSYDITTTIHSASLAGQRERERERETERGEREGEKVKMIH